MDDTEKSGSQDKAHPIGFSWILNSAGLLGLFYAAGFVAVRSFDDLIGVATAHAKEDYIAAAGSFLLDVVSAFRETGLAYFVGAAVLLLALGLGLRLFALSRPRGSREAGFAPARFPPWLIVLCAALSRLHAGIEFALVGKAIKFTDHGEAAERFKAHAWKRV